MNRRQLFRSLPAFGFSLAGPAAAIATERGTDLDQLHYHFNEMLRLLGEKAPDGGEFLGVWCNPKKSGWEILVGVRDEESSYYFSNRPWMKQIAFTKA
ncbi:hypothetical protein [Paracoccus saliphilus]|uniref:NIPSNAP protein n=1 Tax=Paracoccus saliphilus TaxID=405559 RepID=A0AA46A4L6_9RHOB|nr:hypothetical protein [Paracoccus saliphilus]WCR01907.1 hypothetical protein JHX88_13400 [Paracoccus saliphilus]SIS65024.1 hypothetical protein SAMN05421772_102272 [Paracoccus saliphilus]